MKYRKKPIVIEAIRFNDPGLFPQIAKFVGKTCGPLQSADDLTLWRVQINTLEGPLYASLGDWIIKGVKGEVYPCKPDIFEMTYEPVEGQE